MTRHAHRLLAGVAAAALLAAGCANTGTRTPAWDDAHLMREGAFFFLHAVMLPADVPPDPAQPAFLQFADAARARGFNAVAFEAHAPEGGVPLGLVNDALRARRMVGLVMVDAPGGSDAGQALPDWARLARAHGSLAFWFRGPNAADALERFHELAPDTAIFAPRGTSPSALPLALELPEEPGRHFVVAPPPSMRAAP